MPPKEAVGVGKVRMAKTESGTRFITNLTKPDFPVLDQSRTQVMSYAAESIQ